MKTARDQLGDQGMKGAMWYNLGCFAAMLGRNPEAVAHLQRAVATGYADPTKYRNDPDLDPLRTRGDFQRLLAELMPGQASMAR